ncbi:hypothetical protein GBA52_003622 [Prunus armeniaca]|nr:hypothetical protein GBA52_003622 [Prunus armeniaca]
MSPLELILGDPGPLAWAGVFAGTALTPIHLSRIPPLRTHSSKKAHQLIARLLRRSNIVLKQRRRLSGCKKMGKRGKSQKKVDGKPNKRKLRDENGVIEDDMDDEIDALPI